jgi:DNA polymerase III epsilon subunit-like protein
MSKKEEFYQKCLILDTETNSDDYAIAEIVELGFVIRENQNWSIFQELHKPANKIPPKVESICYITNKMVENCPSFSESREVFQDIVNNYRGGFFVGHNQFFDQRVLENHGVDLSNCEWICTWRMAKKLLSEVDGITETNLPYLRFALELDVPIDMLCHRAGNDSYITAKLLEIFVDILEESGVLDKNLPYGPQIVKWTREPIIYEKMPFGKYKGELMSNIPQSYWQWAAKNTQWFDDSADNYDPDLAASIHRVLVLN